VHYWAVIRRVKQVNCDSVITLLDKISPIIVSKKIFDSFLKFGDPKKGLDSRSMFYFHKIFILFPVFGDLANANLNVNWCF